MTEECPCCKQDTMVSMEVIGSICEDCGWLPGNDFCIVSGCANVTEWVDTEGTAWCQSHADGLNEQSQQELVNVSDESETYFQTQGSLYPYKGD